MSLNCELLRYTIRLSKARTIAVRPIGFVRTRASEEEFRTNRKNVVSEVVLDERLTPALDGIDAYSHIIVLFWMHLVTERMRATMKTHPKHKRDLPRVGIFAVRGRSKPNPIGLTVVELVERRKNVLKVRGLDALDGTPVLDVKPYDYMDVKQEITVPEWWSKVHPKDHLQKI